MNLALVDSSCISAKGHKAFGRVLLVPVGHGGGAMICGQCCKVIYNAHEK